MTPTYTINQKDIPDGYYIEVGPGRICEARAAMQHRDDWTPMLCRRLAIVSGGLRFLVDTEDRYSAQSWEEATRLAREMPEKGYGAAQLPTRFQCIEIHKARFQCFDRINRELFLPSDFVGIIWTRDEADDPDVAPRFAYTFDLSRGDIRQSSKYLTVSIRFIWEF